MPMMLEGRVAVVAGGAGSIGGEICRLYATHGAKVLVADRGPDRVDATVAAITAQGGTATGFIADLTAASAMDELAEQADLFGPADILVNCLGHYLKIEPFERNTEQTWQELYEINLLPVFRSCTRFVPGMRERQFGRIINFSSVEGIRASPDMAVYGAFKGAVDAFTRSLAVEVAADNVLVNSIAVDKTRSYQTNFFQFAEDYKDLIPSWLPIGRLGEPADVAKIALFLASDLASWMVGSTLTADGGTMAAGGWYRTPQRWTTMPLLHQYFEPPEVNLARPRSMQ